MDYCKWCSNDINKVSHGGKCPWVTAIEYHPNGTVKRIEFRNGPREAKGEIRIQQPVIEIDPHRPFMPPYEITSDNQTHDSSTGYVWYSLDNQSPTIVE